MQDQEIILDSNDEWNIEEVRSILNGTTKYVIPTNHGYCMKHTECRGNYKCVGLIRFWWRFIDWLCTI